MATQVREKTPGIVLTGAKFWGFVSFITYGVVPLEHRVLWVDCVEIIWVAILSQSAAGKDKGEAEGGKRLRRKAA
tara:strand:+ start:130 stop:354 length:225 start_codon:yes stop_codon:yes gene_type:complete